MYIYVCVCVCVCVCVWGGGGLKAKQLLVDFFNAFHSTHRGKKKQMLQADGLLKEVVTVIMRLYKNTKAMVRSPDGNTDFFGIVAGVLLISTI